MGKRPEQALHQRGNPVTERRCAKGIDRVRTAFPHVRGDAGAARTNTGEWVSGCVWKLCQAGRAREQGLGMGAGAGQEENEAGFCIFTAEIWKDHLSDVFLFSR